MGAGAAYGLYKEKGIEGDEPPPPSHPVGAYIHYHLRPGKHDVTLYDWEQYLQFADHYK
jgi:hypothetical protein